MVVVLGVGGLGLGVVLGSMIEGLWLAPGALVWLPGRASRTPEVLGPQRVARRNRKSAVTSKPLRVQVPKSKVSTENQNYDS